MLSARPVIVPNAGFYTEIADTAAVKVPAEFSVHDIKIALEFLAERPETRHAIATSGKDWATRNCSVQYYVDNLEKLLAEAILVQPYLDLATTYAAQLKQLGFGQSDPIFFQVADCLQGLCEVDAG